MPSLSIPQVIQNLPLRLKSVPELPQKTNAFLHQDHFGFVWIGSVSGLFRFDGKRLETKYTTHGDNIQSPFFEDGQGNLWFTTTQAINCYRRASGNIEHYLIRKADSIFIGQGYYAFHLEAARYLWVIVGNALFRFDTFSTELIQESQFVCPLIAARCMAATNKEGRVNFLIASLWDFGAGAEALWLDHEYKISRRQHFFNKGIEVRGATIENDSLVWLIGDNKLIEFDPQRPRNFRQHLLGRKPEPQIYDFINFPDKMFCIGNQSDFIAFDKASRTFSTLPLKNNASAIKGFQNAFLGKANTVWLSAYGEGVFFTSLKSNGFGNTPAPAGLEKKPITNMVECEGNIWCIAQDGTGMVFRKGRQNPRFFQAEPYSTAFQKDDLGRMWSASNIGIRLWDQHRQLPSEFPSDLSATVWDIFSSSKNELTLATNEGLFVYQAETHKTQKISGLQEMIYAVEGDSRKRLWLTTVDNLKVVEIGLDNRLRLVKDFQLSCEPNDIYESSDQKTIWVASPKGLFKIDAETLEGILISDQDGLPVKYICAIVEDKKGGLWLSTNQGIVFFDPKAVPNQFKHFKSADGLRNKEYYPRAGLISPTGEIWFGGFNGLDVFHPDSIRYIGHAPQLAIVGLKVHDHEWRGDTAIEMLQHLELPYNQNTLRFELAAMEYLDPERNQFKVMLEGYDKHWVSLGTQNFVTYANLPHGQFKFKFIACNAEGIWVEEEKARVLDIVVHPHFSQTWWFQVLIAALSLGLVGFATAFYYRYRLRAQMLKSEKKQREAEKAQLLLQQELALRDQRDQISQGIHDDLGAGLSSIRIASERTLKKFEPETAKDILRRISSTATELDDNRRSLSWATDPEMDSLSSLLARLRRESHTLFEGSAIAFETDIPIEFEDPPMPGAQRLHLLRATKEGLNNALRHANADKISLQVILSENEITILIRDNGLGFDLKTESGKGKGLSGIEKHLIALGGTAEWLANPAGGTILRLNAPLG